MLVAVLTSMALSGPVSDCGLEGDDIVLLQSALGVAYPDALNVLAAVSSARHSGRIDRWLGLDPPATAEESRAALMRVSASLGTLREHLQATAPAGAPSLSVVLLKPMLWNRLTSEYGGLKLAVHVDGLAPGDVVAVTDEPVIAGLNSGRLAARDALSLGLVRLYGSASQVASVRAWLERTEAPTLGTAAARTLCARGVRPPSVQQEGRRHRRMSGPRACFSAERGT